MPGSLREAGVPQVPGATGDHPQKPGEEPQRGWIPVGYDPEEQEDEMRDLTHMSLFQMEGI
jgi:hypothetical protein